MLSILFDQLPLRMHDTEAMRGKNRVDAFKARLGHEIVFSLSAKDLLSPDRSYFNRFTRRETTQESADSLGFTVGEMDLVETVSVDKAPKPISVYFGLRKRLGDAS